MSKKEVTHYPGGGVAVVEYEYGVMFPPPHVNAYEIVWCPDNNMEVFNLVMVGSCIPVRRPVGRVEHLLGGTYE